MIQHLPGSLHNGSGDTRQSRGFNAIAAACSAFAHFVQEDQIVSCFLHQHLKVGHVLALIGEVVELVVMSRKHCACFQIRGEMLTDRPGDG